MNNLLEQKLETVIFNLIKYSKSVSLSENTLSNLINECYSSGNNVKVFGDLPKELIINLFDAGVFTSELIDELNLNLK